VVASTFPAILNRSVTHLDQHNLIHDNQLFTYLLFIPDNQCRFRDLYVSFNDLTKAFDTVCREGLWKIMHKFGCSLSLSLYVSFDDLSVDFGKDVAQQT